MWISEGFYKKFDFFCMEMVHILDIKMTKRTTNVEFLDTFAPLWDGVTIALTEMAKKEETYRTDLHVMSMNTYDGVK